MMSKTSKCEYVATIRQHYKVASKAVKGSLLSDIGRVCGYNRKYAIRLMNTKSVSTVPHTKSRAGRKARYRHSAVVEFLKRLWIASNLACSKRLKAMIPLWLPHDRSGLSPQVQSLLQQISASTIDRLLAPLRHKYTKRGLATTKPGSLLKKQIPINTSQWDERRPGFLEADTVAHCGTSMAGMFVFTLNCVDLATSWSEQRALWGKGEQGVLTALQSIEQSLPFAVRGFDCDNGSEFLNWTILKHFQDRKRPVHYTRSREYQKNDNAHVEGKNWTLIRQFLGYDRFEDQRMVALLNDLYTHQWRLLINFFLPSSKLVSKKPLRSKIVKHFDDPQTPYQRLLRSNVLSASKTKDLEQLFKTLDPFQLQNTITKKINRIVSLATPASFHITKTA